MPLILISLLLGFSATQPARHPANTGGTGSAAAGGIEISPFGSAGTIVYSYFPSCSQTQAIGYADDAGLAGASIFCVDTSTVTSSPNAPTAPTTANAALHYDYRPDSGFPPIPFVSDQATGFPMAVGNVGAFFTQYSTSANYIVRCLRPTQWGQVSVENTNHPVNVGTQGTQTAVNWSNADFLSRLGGLSYVTTANINVSAGTRGAMEEAWTGGGFLLWTRVQLVLANLATSRAFFGMADNVGAFSVSADPNALTDTVYFGCNSGDSNFSICSNDNSGTATCNTLGSSFPCTVDATAYDFWLYMAPGASVINYFVERLDTPVTASGLVTSDLPRNSVQLSWQNWLNSGPSDATAVNLRWYGSCSLDGY